MNEPDLHLSILKPKLGAEHIAKEYIIYAII